MQLTPINPHFKACNQNWPLMPERGDGRHCRDCDRVLMDFTALTEDQLLKLQRDNGFTLCGRYTRSQVERIDRYLTTQEQPNRKPWLVALVLGLSGLIPLEGVAQNAIADSLTVMEPNIEPVTVEGVPIELVNYEDIEPVVKSYQCFGNIFGADTNAKRVNGKTRKKTREKIVIPIGYTVPLPGAPGLLRFPVLLVAEEKDDVVINGKVVDKSAGDPIPYATIILGDSVVGTTDMEGAFSLVMKREKLQDTLKVSYVGFVDRVILLTEKETRDNYLQINVVLEEAFIGLSFVEVRGSTTVMGKVKSIFNPVVWYRKIKHRLWR